MILHVSSCQLQKTDKAPHHCCNYQLQGNKYTGHRKVRTDIGVNENGIKELDLMSVERDFCIALAQIKFKYLAIIHSRN